MNWINLTDKIPSESGLYLCSTEDGSMYIGFYRKERNVFEVWGAGRDPISDIKFTDWMPLPQPPTGKK